MKKALIALVATAFTLVAVPSFAATKKHSVKAKTHKMVHKAHAKKASKPAV